MRKWWIMGIEGIDTSRVGSKEISPQKGSGKKSIKGFGEILLDKASKKPGVDITDKIVETKKSADRLSNKEVEAIRKQVALQLRQFGL